MKKYFEIYLKAVRNVSDITISKYISAIGIINQLLNQAGFFVNDIFDIRTIEELEFIKTLLFSNEEFLKKDKKGNNMYSAAFNHYYRFTCQGEINSKRDIEKLDFIVPPLEKSIIGQIYRYPRNQILVVQVIQSVNFCCEYDVDHRTFTSSVTKHNYVEGHHMIPIEKQNEFNVSLDVYANIVSLCPICHRLLHHGIIEEKLFVVEKIYSERKQRLSNSGINVNVKDIISFIS